MRGPGKSKLLTSTLTGTLTGTLASTRIDIWMFLFFS